MPVSPDRLDDVTRYIPIYPCLGYEKSDPCLGYKMTE